MKKGYLSLTNPEGIKEFNVLSCVHCSGVIVVDKNSAPAGYCGNCGGNICESCDKIGRCTPLEKMLDMAEKKAYRDSQLKLLGIV